MNGFDVSDWLDMMSDTVTITPFTGRSVSGVPTYNGTPWTAPAYIEMKNHLIINHEGREVMAKGRVFMGTTQIPGIEDKVTLPSDYIPVSPPILAVNLVNDEGGTHHVTLEIG